MSILDTLYYYIEETRDPRTLSWPLMSVPTLLIIYFNYLYFIYACGPRYMKDRPAYSLKTLIRCYNIFQILANIVIVKLFLDAEWIREITTLCVPLNTAVTPQTMELASAAWWTYSLKIFDLIETGLFVLRKKNSQISFLHVHHHIIVIFLTWLCVRYIPGGMATFSMPVNACVHVVMYTYYLLSSFPSMQKVIAPFKPMLTTIQMVQLIVIVLYMMISFTPNCLFPRFLSTIAIINILINLYYFGDFYKKSYVNPKRRN